MSQIDEIKGTTTTSVFFLCRRVLAVVGDSRGGRGGLRLARVSPSASSTKTPPPSEHSGGERGRKEGPLPPPVGPEAVAVESSNSNKVGCIYFRRD